MTPYNNNSEQKLDALLSHLSDKQSGESPSDDLWQNIAAQLGEDESLINDDQIKTFDEEWVNGYFDGEIASDEPDVELFERQLRSGNASTQQLTDLESLSQLLFSYHLSVERYVDAHNLCPESLAVDVMAKFQKESSSSNILTFPKRFLPAIGSVAAAVVLLFVAVQANWFGGNLDSDAANQLAFNSPVGQYEDSSQDDFLLASSVSNRPVPSADEYFINYCNTESPEEQDSMTVLYSCFNDAI